MRIGFDAKRAFLNRTGLGNYGRTLIRSLATFYPQNEYFLYAPTLPKNKLSEYFFESKFQLTKAPEFMPKPLWRSRLIIPQLKKDKLNIFHGLSHELPIGIARTGIRTAVTIHDLIFLRFPKLYPFVDRTIYRAKIKYACNHADGIIAISEQTKKDLIQLLNIPPERINVIYQSCSNAFRESISEKDLIFFKNKYGLPKNFLLSVGTIEERKNLLLITKALKYLPKELKCVVLGKKTNYFQQINTFLEKEKLQNRMIFLPDLLASELPALYQSASVFIYPSRFEGFGIPVLEALCSSVPVIAATGSCLEEAGGPDSIYISPDDEIGLAKSVVRILNSKEEAERMRENGKDFSSRFTDQKTAQQLMGFYEHLNA